MPSRLSRQDQIDRMTEKHQGFYTYERWDHPGYNEESIITCPIHGDFYQSYKVHISGSGCQTCGNEKKLEASLRSWESKERRANHSEMLKERWKDPEFRGKMSQLASEHMRRLMQDPEFVARLAKKSSIRMKAKFEDPKYREHIGNVLAKARLKQGKDSLGEQKVKEILSELGFDPEREKIIPGTLYRFDFYIKEYDLIIEVHGVQHYKGWGNKKRKLEEKQGNDAFKAAWADMHNHNLLVLPYKKKADLNKFEGLIIKKLVELGHNLEIFAIDKG